MIEKVTEHLLFLFEKYYLFNEKTSNINAEFQTLMSV
jgi:hypothetical protein